MTFEKDQHFSCNYLGKYPFKTHFRMSIGNFKLRSSVRVNCGFLFLHDMHKKQ